MVACVDRVFARLWTMLDIGISGKAECTVSTWASQYHYLSIRLAPDWGRSPSSRDDVLHAALGAAFTYHGGRHTWY
jgi:hypothetical protein